MPTPVDIGGVTDRQLRITWSDGHESVYSWQRLRIHCPCARCKGEWRYAPAPLTAKDVPADIRAMAYQRVGAYALRFVWSDHHDTGIYPFNLLRFELCECAECRASSPSSQSTPSSPSRTQAD
ncbi:MAG TPA: DUF971 domain-containing protein [bacterium]|jgi:DUF971 family protein